MAQSGKWDIGGDNSELIPCLKKDSLKSADLKKVQVEKYKDSKKPTMPGIEAMAEIVSKGETAAKLERERYPLLPRNHPNPQNTLIFR